MKSRNLISRRGFTLLEAVIVLVIAGILVTIAAPAFLAWLNNQRLTSAQSQVESIFRQAQSTAKQKHVDYQVSFKRQDYPVEWVIHPANSSVKTQTWQTLNTDVKLSLADADTTLIKDGDIYKMVFNHRGELSATNGRLGGRITLVPVSGGSRKRCVFISNLLGTTRLGENRPNRQGNPCE
jgi:prepilin-type N-terminal cleavage/methylation domain-containing protein